MCLYQGCEAPACHLEFIAINEELPHGHHSGCYGSKLSQNKLQLCKFTYTVICISKFDIFHEFTVLFLLNEEFSLLTLSSEFRI